MKILRTDIDTMMKGFFEAAKVVVSTLGPHGRNVGLDDPYTKRIINDGARIANAIDFEDKMMSFGAYVVKNASAKTNDDVGDGTTTTIVLLKAIVEEALKHSESRAEIKRSLEAALPKAIELLKQSSVPMRDEDINRVAFLVSEHQDLADLLTEIYQKLGHDAAIQIEDSKTNKTYYEIEDGYRLYDGYISDAFFTNRQTLKAEYEDVPVVVAFQKLDKDADLMPIAQQFREQGINKAVFFLQDISDHMLGTLIKNHLPPPLGTGGFHSLAIKCLPEQLEDIAALTGARIVGEQNGVLWENLKLDDLGHADSVVADKNTTLLRGDGDLASKRAIELDINATDEPNMYRQARLRERAARLRGKIAILKVGGYTELEREYRELKAEDTIKAIPAAFEENLVQGAGLSFASIATKLGEDGVGNQILRVALRAPFEQLQLNAGILKGEFPIDDNGLMIIDPLKVERVSLENAVSAAAMILTTVAVVTLENDRPDQRPGTAVV